MYPTEHTRALWPAPNSHYSKSRPPVQKITHYPNSFCFVNFNMIIDEAKSTLKIKSEKVSGRFPRNGIATKQLLLQL